MSEQILGAPSDESAATRFFRRLWRGVGRLIDAVLLLRESVVGMVGAGIIVFWVVIALMPGWLAPFNPLEQVMPLQMP
ncbi:MAG TPA: hypothetical protein VLS27_03090, partial [Gammaproteobacteria bacterium]|nr:hypothetical protein [Gammaproteobacteria bacterium]